MLLEDVTLEVISPSTSSIAKTPGSLKELFNPMYIGLSPSKVSEVGKSSKILIVKVVITSFKLLSIVFKSSSYKFFSL